MKYAKREYFHEGMSFGGGAGISVEFPRRGVYLSVMRRWLIGMALVCGLAVAGPARAASGRVIKVLPEYLDLKGRTSLSPSLYERDAYQASLRNHPEKRSGMRFYVQWKAKGSAEEPLKLRVEVRGAAKGNLPKELVLELPVQPGGWFSHWSALTLSGKEYKEFGAVTAWRVTLWEGGRQLGKQKSFLW